jgi:tripartite-type tricarboxylate transporter receptor subunit TctC
MGFSTTTSWAPALNMQPQQMGFDPRKDFASVSLLGDTHYLLIVNADLGVNSVADLVALAKRKPGSLNFSSTGEGSIAHLGMLIIAKKLGIEMTHVP